jgi:CubicO group peptidase (beta-lactamase class C family)
VPAAEETEWVSATPASEGVDGAKLERGIERLSDHDPNLRSVLVAHEGRLIEERYFHGGNAAGAENINSASKSVMQALLSIAVQDGYIGSLQEPVARYLPGLFSGLPDAERKITIADMLDMQSGLRWREERTEYTLQASSDWIGGVLEQGLAATPGSGRFDYSTGNFHVLSAVLSAATGMSSCRFAEQQLFGPLGIYPAHWGVDPTSGVDMGGCDLYMTSRALARFAQLYLDGGTAAGRRLLPTSAVSEAATATHTDGGGFLYDSGWWSRTIDGVPMFMAWGWNGQFAYVIPSLKLVLVTTEDSRDGDGPFREINSGRFIARWLLPALGSAAPRVPH